MDSFKDLLKMQELYILGVSGGCDSMALLDMMNQAGYQIIVCHVNYHLREDSDLDQQTVEAYCHRYDLPCYVREIDKQVYGPDNFQDQARRLRYQFYLEIGMKYQTQKVVLAHHQNDVIENIVMQLQRHNTKGYLGIQEISEVFGVTVIRPCLAVRKQFLRDYCHGHNVEYRDDYTNFQTEFTRDYVRNVTLKDYDEEKIEKLLKWAQEHNQRYASKLKQLQIYLDLYHQKNKIDYTCIPKELLDGFIYEILKIFSQDSKIGMVGMVGSPVLPMEGVMWAGARIGALFTSNVKEVGPALIGEVRSPYEQVEAVDGLLIATQEDLPWRGDIFTGWDFYDISQSMEYRKAGYKVVVPQMEYPWCLHDDGFVNLETYFKWRDVFLKEYGDMLHETDK